MSPTRARLMAGAIALLASAGTAAAAPVTRLLADYDLAFKDRCGGTACEQAVAEMRNGDNGTTARTFEWNVGPTTAAPASTANVTGASDFWGTSYAFTLAYTGGTLSFGLNVPGATLTGDSSNPTTYPVILAATQSLFIRAVSRDGLADTVLSNLLLNGTAINGGSFSGNSVADYLSVTNFDWAADWTLTGSVSMDGVSSGSQARPSVQFKLTDLEEPVPVPAPAALGLFAVALAGLSLVRRRA